MMTRALHVASFSGNIGDNASHSGTYRLLEEAIGASMSVTPREIRQTYVNYRGPNRWHFDDSFVEAVNMHDLTLIGGGNYFELWLEDSATGTTIDMDPKLLKRVERPLVFNALGCDPYKGYSSETVDRFGQFLEQAMENPAVVLSVRNDGSRRHLASLVGESLANEVDVIPDPGFFVDPTPGPHPETKIGRPHWVMNIAIDMPKMRFGEEDEYVHAGYDNFIRALTEVVESALTARPGVDLVLAPHIFSDIKGDYDLLRLLPDDLRRNRVSVAPYGHGELAAEHVFDLYRTADLVIGMRFHANVCPIGMGIPTIGIISYPKIADLYDEIGQSHRCVRADDHNFQRSLTDLIANSTSVAAQIRRDYNALRKQLHDDAIDFYRGVAAMIAATR